MLSSRKKREKSKVTKARHGAARGLERAATAVDHAATVVDVDESTPKKRRRGKPLLLVALAGIGAWVVAQARRSPTVADATQDAADKVAAAGSRTATEAQKASSAAAKAGTSQPAKAGNSTR